MTRLPLTLTLAFLFQAAAVTSAVALDVINESNDANISPTVRKHSRAKSNYDPFLIKPNEMIEEKKRVLHLINELIEEDKRFKDLDVKARGKKLKELIAKKFDESKKIDGLLGRIRQNYLEFLKGRMDDLIADLPKDRQEPFPTQLLMQTLNACVIYAMQLIFSQGSLLGQV